MARLPAIPPDQYDARQRQAAAEFLAIRNRAVYGPFEALIYSPELMSSANAMGEYLRYRSGIGTTLSELAILITARHWSQDYEWHVHAATAAKAGISPDTIESIRDGRRPQAMSDDETVIYDFTIELQHNKQVSDATWARAETRFGKPALVDLIGLSGYYTFLAMQMNAARHPLPEGAPKLPRFPS